MDVTRRPPRALVLDFTGVPGAETFKGGALPAGGELAVFNVDPLRAHVAERQTIAHQAAVTCDSLVEHPDFVLAYCTGASLAVAVAAELRARAVPEPRVVLIDPQIVTDSNVRVAFEGVLNGLDADPEPVLRRSAGMAGAALLAEFEHALTASRERLVELHGGDDEAAMLVDFILARHRSWLRFLASSAAVAEVSLGRTVHFVSANEHLDLKGILAHPRSVRGYGCDAPEGAMLAHPHARHLIRHILLGSP